MRLILLLLLTSLVLAAPLDRFERDIRDYEERPRPAPGGTLFLGSSTFRLWGHALETTFAEFDAINRGFGGATIPEITHYYDRLVEPLHPRQIVFYAGTNDVAEGHSAEQVYEDYKAFRARGTVPVWFISMSIPPSRVQFTPVYREANRLIRELDPAHYIDVSQCLLDASGQPHEGYFREDRLHMNAAGYAQWVPVIRAALGRSPEGNPR